ncbi:hypothetical protein FB451DRAFT_1172107 [Mycena latifolia]|nr:hypothetical protein FB451DRAFT_1172107 [Mycena latifolia]
MRVTTRHVGIHGDASRGRVKRGRESGADAEPTQRAAACTAGEGGPAASVLVSAARRSIDAASRERSSAQGWIAGNARASGASREARIQQHGMRHRAIDRDEGRDVIHMGRDVAERLPSSPCVLAQVVALDTLALSFRGTPRFKGFMRSGRREHRKPSDAAEEQRNCEEEKVQTHEQIQRPAQELCNSARLDCEIRGGKRERTNGCHFLQHPSNTREISGAGT